MSIIQVPAGAAWRGWLAVPVVAITAIAFAWSVVDAHAAAPWSAPVKVLGPAPIDYQAPVLAATSRRLVGWWEVQTGSGTVRDPLRGALAFDLAPSARSPARQISGLGTAPAAFGSTRVVSVRELDRGKTKLGAPIADIQVAFGDTGGHVGTFATIERNATLFSRPVVAADPRGDVAVAWVEHVSGGRDHLRLALRRPGRAFQAPTTLAGTSVGDGPGLSEPTLAWGAGSDLVVAFQRRTGLGLQDQEVAARVRRAGHHFGSIVRLTRSRGSADIAAAVAANGRVVVAWGVQDLGEEANTPFIVGAAVKPAGPHDFRASQTLDPGAANKRSQGTVALALASDGTATVAWSSAQPRASNPIRMATTNADGRFGAPQALGVQGGVAGLAVDRDGRAALEWTNDYPGPLYVALRPAGARAFGAPETVSTPGQAIQAASAAIAFDPQTHDPVALWASREAANRATIHVARRTGR